MRGPNHDPLDVLVLGGAGVDTIVEVPRLPLPYADSYLVPAITTRAGHTGDNVALGLHALGLHIHLLDVLGEDAEGALVRDLHQRSGSGFTALATAAGTKRAVNLVGPDGRRLSLYDGSRGAEQDRFPTPLLAELLEGCRHVHVCITHPAAYALDQLTAAGIGVSTDLHDWDGENPYHAQFAAQADVVFLSAAALADPEAVMRHVLKLGRAHTVVATAGDRGGLLLTRDGDGARRWTAVAPPRPVRDSNGAGDAFVAGFLFGLLEGRDLDECARLGALAGAHACTVAATEVDPIDRAALLAHDTTF
ncbi:carbohydrate kinase family protein [Catellatospora bangladeshensis]|uniref:Sugar kinase n=1 Tax=Catellatospora bangladeshensis TaxID=310355 RepID=A0A8J3JTH6_9ACTN|nr:PfkB family carbohydrate kinase [Catellatospora bangladeshensis]GIF84870.1 sugar kinase [Catellatospora bangladeshensis]